MEKLKKIVKRFFEIYVIIEIVFILIIICSVCYEFHDVIGLNFYDNEPVRDFYIVSYGKYIIVTDEGEGYVCLQDASSIPNPLGRKLLNAQDHTDRTFKTSEPICFFEGNIKTVWSNERGSTFFLTDEDKLYRTYDGIKTKLIANNVKYAVNAPDGKIFYVDINNDLYLSNGKKEPLLSGISDVRTMFYYNTLLTTYYVTTIEGELCELYFSKETAQCELSEPLFTGVQKFDLNYYYYYDSKSIDALYVLTSDNNLYVKGYLCSDPSIHKYYEDWTLIDTEVTDFSSTINGMVYAKSDGSIRYYGYDPSGGKEFGDITLPYSNVKSFSMIDQCVILIDEENRLYVYGDCSSNSIFGDSESVNIFSDEPLTIEMPR